MNQAEVALVVAAALELDAASLDPAAPLARYGLDSLATVELLAALERRFGITLDPESLDDAPTLASLVEALARGRPAARPIDPFASMVADAELGDLALAPARADRPPRRILLTGATGFLGAFLVERLLREPGLRLVCPVRCPDPDAGHARILAGLARYGLAAADSSRLEVLPANLALPGLGLGARERTAALETDAVCHLAAAVHWVAPYAALRAINVRATRELLALAGEGKARPFHVLSSLAAIYSTLGPRVVDEETDPLAALRGLHFGYAQSKAVADALARAAAAAGLPTTIYRAGLIAGSSRSGVGNSDDFFAQLWRGCVRLGAAPDLDWALDPCPVDHVVEVLARGITGGEAGGILHLKNPRPRFWREAVLWINLYGHDVALRPYEEWLALLRQAIERDEDQPLHGLRGFFQARADGAYLPELYQEGRRAVALADRTRAALTGLPECPALDSALMERYADALVARGALPAPAARPPAEGVALQFDRDFFAALLPEVARVEKLESGSRHSILTELTSWAYGRNYGLSRHRVFGPHGARDLLVKAKPRDSETMAVACRVAALADAELGQAYAPWVASLGFAGGPSRELALLGLGEPRWRRHLPRVEALVDDPAQGVFVAVVEWLEDVEQLDSADDPSGWTPAHLEAAVCGLADLHAVFWGRAAELRTRPWLGRTLAPADLAAMGELWQALERFSRPSFERWGGGGLAARRQSLLDDVPRWAAVLAAQPQTLIHHDCNPRNLCFRRAPDGLVLLAYDWELATLQAPQRDLAELLTFVLAPGTGAETLELWVERSRRALEAAAGEKLDEGGWRAGFAAALADLMVQRLPLYAVVDRFRPQRFLPRVVATWRRLDEITADW